MWQEEPGKDPAVRLRWRAVVESAGRYGIAGSDHWGISFIRRPDGSLAGELDGPTLSAQEVDSIPGEEYWGVELAAWVMVADLPKQPILGLTLPMDVAGSEVRLGGRAFPVPAYDELDSWVRSLIEAKALIADDEIRRALEGDRVGATDRTWQRRFRRTVGLTAAQVDQVRRAERAYALLQAGMRPIDAAMAAGFSDQAHLTRSLKLIRGRTPAAILADARHR